MLYRAVVSHDDVVGHGLDDVVQRLMFPVGDPGTRGVQSHAKWCGSKYARHFRIGVRTLGNLRIVLVRLGRRRRVFRMMANGQLVHALFLAPGCCLTYGRKNDCKRHVAVSYSLSDSLVERVVRPISSDSMVRICALPHAQSHMILDRRLRLMTRMASPAVRTRGSIRRGCYPSNGFSADRGGPATNECAQSPGHRSPYGFGGLGCRLASKGLARPNYSHAVLSCPLIRPRRIDAKFPRAIPRTSHAIWSASGNRAFISEWRKN
jgi:hypothetical protein